MVEWLFIVSAIAGLLSFFSTSIYRVWKGRDPKPFVLLTALCCGALIVNWWKTTPTSEPPPVRPLKPNYDGGKETRSPPNRRVHSPSMPPDPVLIEALTTPEGLPGANSDGGSAVWPFRYKFTAIDGKSGAVIGEAEAFTGGVSCPVKLEGTLSGDTLEFKWASFVRPCNGRLGVLNKLSLNQDRLVGNWTFDGRTGPAWIVLHRDPSRIIKDLRKTASTRGFEFQVHPCLLNEYTVVCDLVVVNNIEEQQLTFGGDGTGHMIEAYDNGGNRYEPEYVQLANEQSGKTINHLMITRVPTSARVVFYHFNENATEIVALKVPFATQRLGALAVEFQHIPLHW